MVRMACQSYASVLSSVLGQVAIAAAANVTTSLPPVQACATTHGNECIFPFVYKGVTYNSCTMRDAYSKPWCATEVDANASYMKSKWGSCNDQCFASTLERHENSSDYECVTTGGKQCVFPFVYKGVSYNSCTQKDAVPLGLGKFWCATELDANGTYVESKWGNCDQQCFSDRHDANKGGYGNKMRGHEDGRDAGKDPKSDDAREGRGGHKDRREERDHAEQHKDGDIGKEHEEPRDHNSVDETERSQGNMREWRTEDKEDKQGKDSAQVNGDKEAAENVQTKGDKDADNIFANKVGIAVVVCLLGCLLLCALTIAVTVLGVRLGRKERELKTIRAISPNVPLPQVTGTPVDFHVNPDQKDTDQKIAEP